MHGLPEMVAFSPAAHKQIFIAYCAEQLLGGQMGLFALAIGAVNVRANRAAASKSRVFFTVKLLVEVEVAP